MEQTTKKKLRLVNSQLCYDIYIPKEVEQKIRTLCREVHDVEWSGVLFYTVKGSFETKDLEIHCVDIFPMDIGNSTYTEFRMSPDVTTYIVDHPELMTTVYQGLIHSHNNMQAFFSGTDNSTLVAEGTDVNHFVSLIVNNAGQYVARITRHLYVKSIIADDISYKSFNDVDEGFVDNYEDTDEYIEYTDLKIHKEEVEEPKDELLSRLDEIKKSKEAVKPKYSIDDLFSKPNTATKGIRFGDYRGGKYVPLGQYEKKQPELFDKEFNNEVKSVTNTPYFDSKYGKMDVADIHGNPVAIDSKFIDWIVGQIITCNVFLPVEGKFKISDWVPKMDKVYKKRFNDVKSFEAFATNFIDFIINETDNGLYLPQEDPYDASVYLANAVLQRLDDLEDNPWITKWMEIVRDYCEY